jgi:TetR/AcrR family transcriptional regulator, copper-responsive repressor
MVQKSVASAAPRRRGRPPQYDAAAALAQARDAFWRMGYQATSLDDIVAATGMNRPSLYGAFGDKRALFLAALRQYRAANLAVTERLLRAAPSLRVALNRVFAAAIALYLGDKKRGGGCFILGAAPSEAESDDAVRAELRAVTSGLDAAFAKRIARAQEEGELPAAIDAAARGRLATATIHSLSLRARAHEPRAALAALAADAAALLSDQPQ